MVPKKKYKVLHNFNLKLKTFEVLEIVVKSEDQNYTIQQIVGGFFYRENFSDCYKKQNEVFKLCNKILFQIYIHLKYIYFFIIIYKKYINGKN